MLKRSRKNSRQIKFFRHRLAVKFLFSLIFGAILFGLITIYIVPILSSVNPQKSSDRTLTSDWGINNGTGYNTELAYVDRSIKHTKDLRLSVVRMGIDGVGGQTEGAPFDWSARDIVVNKYLKAGIKIHAPIGPRFHVNRDGNYEQWKANFRYFARNVMAHYKGKIFYYIIDNEPDIDYGNGKMSAQQCVDMTRIAYTTAREIDPKIKIESPPPKGPESELLSQMLDLGVAKVSDYIGMHIYGGQIREGELIQPWKALAAHSVRKPIAISESGSIASWYQGSSAKRDDNRRRWFAIFGQQAKRYGYDHALLFDLDGHDEWAVAPNFKPTSSYQEIKSLRLDKTLSNPGFESSNDGESEWVHFNNEDVALVPSPYVTFVRSDAKGAHGGNGYVKLESGKAGGGKPIFVRQIASQLKQGKVKIGAWVYVNGGTTATLKAQGYDYFDGDAELSKSSTKKNTWEYIEITAPISRYWTVIELGSVGTGKLGEYVKWDDVTVRAI